MECEVDMLNMYNFSFASILLIDHIKIYWNTDILISWPFIKSDPEPSGFLKEYVDRHRPDKSN